MGSKRSILCAGQPNKYEELPLLRGCRKTSVNFKIFLIHWQDRTEKEKVSVSASGTDWNRVRKRVCVCLCLRAYVSAWTDLQMCMSVCKIERERERQCLRLNWCTNVCVLQWKREREIFKRKSLLLKNFSTSGCSSFRSKKIAAVLMQPMKFFSQRDFKS